MRRDRQRLSDILEALNSITGMLGTTSESDFISGELLRYAVAHKLTVIGEAAARLSPEFRAAHPSVPWSDITCPVSATPSKI